MKTMKVTMLDLDSLADKLGCTIQHDCGGFRVTRRGRNLFPANGVCPTASKRDCFLFLKDVEAERKEQHDANSKVSSAAACSVLVTMLKYAKPPHKAAPIRGGPLAGRQRVGVRGHLRDFD